MNVPLDEIMLRFAGFLRISWEAAHGAGRALEHVKSDELMSDWAQANWELLVETPFRELVGFGSAFLEPYGEGADCNQASSRVWNPDALLTHRIICRPRDGASIRDLLANAPVDVTASPVVFDHFAARAKDGWYEQAPPFDCVLGYHNDREVLISLDQVSFVAEEISKTADGTN
jgi:hypothetical protein